MQTKQQPNLRSSDISDYAQTGIEFLGIGGATKIPLLTELRRATGS